jgi:hypothetical protein
MVLLDDAEKYLLIEVVVLPKGGHKNLGSELPGFVNVIFPTLLNPGGEIVALFESTATPPLEEIGTFSPSIRNWKLVGPAVDGLGVVPRCGFQTSPIQ